MSQTAFGKKLGNRGYPKAQRRVAADNPRCRLGIRLRDGNGSTEAGSERPKTPSEFDAITQDMLLH